MKKTEEKYRQTEDENKEYAALLKKNLNDREILIEYKDFIIALHMQYPNLIMVSIEQILGLNGEGSDLNAYKSLDPYASLTKYNYPYFTFSSAVKIEKIVILAYNLTSSTINYEFSIGHEDSCTIPEIVAFRLKDHVIEIDIPRNTKSSYYWYIIGRKKN